MSAKGKNMNKRRWLPLAAFFLLGACNYLGGAWTRQPEELPGNLSAEAQRLLDLALQDVPAGDLRDHHTHILGMDQSDQDHPDAWINLRGLSLAHPVDYVKTLILQSASGIKDWDKASAQYVERLVRLIKNSPKHGKHYILAFDYHHAPGCGRDLGKSDFFTANEYVMELAARFPDIFIPAISVHPYRTDAVQLIEYFASLGARMVKWLPNSMGINACDRRLKDYYCALKRNNMTLNVHAGEEQAVKAGEGQTLGNPLLLRYPLDLGVKVIVAHSASLGANDDLDAPGESAGNFDLFLRLMNDSRYQDNLLGDISATTQYNRLRFDDREGGPLLELLRRPELHGRLVNGSDYPLPAVNWVVHLNKIRDLGMITDEKAMALRETYDFNPLLFDFVLKRSLRDEKTGQGFPASVFLANKEFLPEWTPSSAAAPSYQPPKAPGRCPVMAMPSMGDVWALCGQGKSGPRHNDKCE